MKSRLTNVPPKCTPLVFVFVWLMFGASQANASTYQTEVYGHASSHYSGYTGYGYVNIGYNAGATLTVSNANLASGRYRLWVRYAMWGHGQQSCGITINGETVGNLIFQSTGSWESWASVKLDFTLPEGGDTIVVTKESGGAALFLDYLYFYQYPEPKYHLAVINGRPDGDYYAGTVVTIQADTQIDGGVFDHWVANPDIAWIANRESQTTTLNMPSSDVTLTAEYQHYPAIKRLVFTPDRDVSACHDLQVKAVAEDVDGDEIEFKWEIVSHPANADPTLTAQADRAILHASLPGDYEVLLTVCDDFDLCSQRQFPVRILATTDYNRNGVDDACETAIDRHGRVVTILLTLSNEHITQHQPNLVTTLIANAIGWVRPVNDPRVLVVLDDNNQGEYEDDAAFVHISLLQSGVSAEFITEPVGGLLPADLEDVEVVWFSNPGYPINDETTIETLLGFVQSGGGLVLQGDDMSWREAAIPLTHLEYIDNGTQYCSQDTDNNVGAHYVVEMVTHFHPVIDGLEGISFAYGDDIDTSNPIHEDEIVLAWTSRVDICDDICAPKPVIVALEISP